MTRPYDQGLAGRIAAFAHDQPAVRIVFGAGTFERLADELDDRRWLIVHGGSQATAAEQLGERLGERCAGRFAELGADGLVAVGGGSVIGLAKAIALTAQAPIAAVPTTYSGS